MIVQTTDLLKIKSIFDKKYSILSLHLPEVIAVKFGLKTSTTIDIPHGGKVDKYLSLIHNFCSKTGLYFNYYFRRKECTILISNKRLSVVQDSEGQNKDNRFSYPKCCRDNFSRMYSGHYLINDLRQIIANEKGNTHFDFEMNPFLILSPFHLYVHLPCSLKCEKTLDYAKRLLRIIKNENMALYSAIVNFNKVPVFYTDVCGTGILFDGAMKSEKGSTLVSYKKFYYLAEPRNKIDLSNYNFPKDVLLFEKIIHALNRGDVIILREDRLTIRNKNCLIGVFKKPDHLFWKMIDFS